MRVLRPYQPRVRRLPINGKKEQTLQQQVCQYLRLQYPSVIFRSDFASGLALTPHQAITHRNLQSSRSWPDLFIYAARRGHYGLALELKQEGTTIIIKRGPKKGQLTANPHIREQFFMLRELKKRGYYANFACGFDEAKKIIDWYFGRIERENGELF
jgi:hypothetical protein